MLLTHTTDSLNVFVSSTDSDVDFLVIYSERNQVTGDFGATEKQFDHITSEEIQYDILGAPGANTDRHVEFISIRNAHATVPVHVTVQYDANGTSYELFAAFLRAGDSIEYTYETGFRVLLGSWERFSGKKISYGITRDVRANAVSYTVIVDDTMTVIPSLPIAAAAVTRWFGCFCHWHDLAGATTTGIGMQVGSPNAVTTRWGRIEACVASVTAATLSAQSDTTTLANGTSAVTFLPGFMGGHVSMSQAAFDVVYSMYAAITPEVVASNISVERGCLFEVFENTD